MRGEAQDMGGNQHSTAALGGFYNASSVVKVVCQGLFDEDPDPTLQRQDGSISGLVFR